MSSFGDKFKVTLDGTSHGAAIYIRMEGVQQGIEIDEKKIYELIARRSPIGKEGATTRVEPDKIVWESGFMRDGGLITNGQPIRARIDNLDVKSSDYDELKYIPRPGHADFAAYAKDGLNVEITGGGRFSGRLTAALCVAGGIAEQVLEKMGVAVNARCVKIGGVACGADGSKAGGTESCGLASIPAGDSVGGLVECVVTGVKPGSCGDSYFDGLEGKIAQAVFAIPAVKGVEFGEGFRVATMLGSENNDEMRVEDGKVKMMTNHAGGILGGIATGEPIIIRAAVKPTPSIAKPQKTVNIKTMENVEIAIKGRHDACIAVRAAAAIEAAVAIAVLNEIV